MTKNTLTTSPSLHIHMIAICGTAMGPFALMLKEKGHRITGSDENIYPPISTMLQDHQIPIFSKFQASNLEPKPDLVIIGNAVSRGNPEAEAVLEQKIRYVSLPEAIKNFFLWEQKSIVVAGTHGKTTTTAMLAWVFTQAELKPSYIIGGIPIGMKSGTQLGSGDFFILEGDEYDSAFFDKRAKFLHYLPDTVVINNIEYDHADIYNSLEEIVLSFKRLVNTIPLNGFLTGPLDDKNFLELASNAFCPVELIGEAPTAKWSADNITVNSMGTSFDLYECGILRCRLSIRLLGIHNVKNTLAVVAVARHYGIDWDKIVDSLGSFTGVRRRLEIKGEVNDITVYDDFAHHPTAVNSTLEALNQAFPKEKIWAVFEPRTATSIRRIFQEAYIAAFDHADFVIIAPAFKLEKAPFENRFSVEELVLELLDRGVKARAITSIDLIVSYLGKNVKKGNKIVFMSNGGFGNIHDKMLNHLASLEQIV
tara:strand:- start:33846 stop:35285 length:1440 start_codon:yes stop_codon:yes gene_type:complete